MIQNALPRLGSWQENVLLWQDWRVERFEEWLSERGWETFQSDMSEVLKIVFILFSFLGPRLLCSLFLSFVLSLSLPPCLGLRCLRFFSNLDSVQRIIQEELIMMVITMMRSIISVIMIGGNYSNKTAIISIITI